MRLNSAPIRTPWSFPAITLGGRLGGGGVGQSTENDADVDPPAGTHGFAAGRALFDGRGLLWGELGLALLGCAVLGAVVVAFLTRMLSTFRTRGYISRYT